METIEIRWDLLGAKLARLSNVEQANFFKGFAFELEKYESSYQRQMQMFYIRDKLNSKEISILEECLSCFWFEDK